MSSGSLSLDDGAQTQLSGESGQFANVKSLLSSKFCTSQSPAPALQSSCPAKEFEVLPSDASGVNV